jgi:hypothetical protein
MPMPPVPMMPMVISSFGEAFCPLTQTMGASPRAETAAPRKRRRGRLETEEEEWSISGPIQPRAPGFLRKKWAKSPGLGEKMRAA